jgi:probable rRNA maturation factor
MLIRPVFILFRWLLAGSKLALAIQLILRFLEMEIKPLVPRIHFHFLVLPFYFPRRNQLKAFLASIFEREHTKLATLTYIFCSDEYLLDINRAHLNHDYFTDIITFDLSEGHGIVGEIYISVERVRENALTFNSSFQDELRRVIFHGALHLCGYGDKTSAEKLLMRSVEDKYLHLFAAL